ncbi:MAG TPA: peptide deformylase [Elusimicrobia bacterium]|nr:peptide deformylase [Elusimicrobiota bacterium]
MILRITKHGEPVLKKPAPPVDFDAVKNELPRLLGDMWATMYAARGVGLSAQQVGLVLRLSIIDVKPEGKPERLVLLNPEILSREGLVIEEEGCLSIPGLYRKTRRYSRVRIRALDENGQPWERTGTGLLARAFQHEVDHLDGKLFIDQFTLDQRLEVAAALKELKKTWL